ncbi:hypothetical protein PAXRUDRAFT_831574 [Paxillus rubicundulus Ve08.2h10]|uniref:Uncharacterized protein n=1 Tax=Paxillus rubicundulus Ve08.2h10 TaxID=930991 RepID=A0A0D0DRT8_9AGAM|nr:hypothetical protein PAXRUDRAFT_831574 [Paxillus rubicundulus Ve08.2h10]
MATNQPLAAQLHSVAHVRSSICILPLALKATSRHSSDRLSLSSLRQEGQSDTMKQAMIQLRSCHSVGH